MNLVVGATGTLGGEICARLVQAGKPVRGLVRASSSPERVDALRKAGVELATGDLRDRASLDAGLASDAMRAAGRNLREIAPGLSTLLVLEDAEDLWPGR